MEVDSKAEDSSWETQSELTTSNSKVLIDADVLSKITATLERLTLQVEKMQARVEETGLQGKQINRGVQPKTRSGRRGVVRTEELNIFKVRLSKLTYYMIRWLIPSTGGSERSCLQMPWT